MPGEYILVVEDNDVLREGLQLIIEAEGFQTIGAANGIDAMLQMNSVTPDLILSDISMPEMDGFAFYQAVRSHQDWVPVPFIFLTARSEREQVIAGKKLGVEDYLVKPVDRKELLTTIRSRLERSQQLMLAQFNQAYEASMIMLANAIELRDHYTRGHVERVMQIAMMIARQMGWTPAQLKPLQYGAILHDIGKIHVRESILYKAGPLDKDEWGEMKLHAAIGAELLDSVPYLSAVIPIIRYHHERWDGKGYPEGLAREEIPIGARIVAVADAYDAMTTARVYQQASSTHQAIDEIRASSGTRYDPNVVKAFLHVWDQIERSFPSAPPIS
jgi:putative two-component system response regulator